MEDKTKIMRNITRTDIGERLFNWMIKNPMSMVSVAEKIGISRNSVLSITRGATEPRNEVRCKIERFLKEQES